MDIDIDTDRYYSHKVKGILTNIHNYEGIRYATIGLVNECELETIKPYLFPLSSMTKKQIEELESLMEVTTVPYFGEVLSPTPKYYDWLDKNKFDYRGLIPKGLAIDATGLNIY